MNNIEIKKVALTDLEQLQMISTQTFIETFSEGNTEENMQTYVAETFCIDRLTSEINNTNSEFYFASLVNEVIGYIKVNVEQAQTELKDEKALEIERIYVLKAFQGRKAGQILCNKAIQLARQANADYVWLGVWEENHKAISFYKKHGFTEFDKHIFMLGNDEQTDLMMKLIID